jgi:thiol-disulfide isomerase/thioredoxin
MTSLTKNLTGVALMALGMGTLAQAQNLKGRWSANTEQGGAKIPFRLDISGEGDKAVGTLYNGEDKEYTTSAVIKDGKVELNFDHYLVAIVAEVKNGELDGRIESRRGGPAAEEGANNSPSATPATPARRGVTPFHAVRYVAPTAAEVKNVPNVDGVWEVARETPKGEKAWRVVVQQKGSDITTTILRVDGDTGALTGSWQPESGKFVASHFDGARPGLITLTPKPDGSLGVELNTGNRNGDLIAYRPEVARAKGLPEPSNYQTHTTVRDPNEVFTYSFPDTKGNIVSNEDPKYKGKVVLAIVTGTWCPNCHDEAQYLVELYKKYHDRGLEIVALDFEEPTEISSHKRVTAFVKQYKVPYAYLIAGQPSEMWDKVPQLVNLNTWPATVFVGRDGKVKATHAGFAAPASGVFNQQLKEEFTSNIERLLKEEAGLVSSASLK